jgi:8-oxo-dGTP diphosphatase
LAERFVYVIAFKGDGFLMVRHRERKWEMPGGRLCKCESHEDAARREFVEETGHSLKEIIGEIKIDREGGKVFVGLAGNRVNCELSSEIVEVNVFHELPSELSFPLVEYRSMLDQAKARVENFKTRKGIGRTASPLNSNDTE